MHVKNAENFVTSNCVDSARARCRGGCECTVCPPGKKVGTPAGNTTDRTCTACPRNTFSTEKNSKECKHQPECSEGEFIQITHHEITSDLSKTEEGECRPCPKNTYQPKTWKARPPSERIECIKCKVNQITFEEGAKDVDKCKDVQLSIRPSSHRLWVQFNVATEQYTCAVLSILIVDKINGNGIPLIAPHPLPEGCTAAEKNRPEFGGIQRSFLGGKDPLEEYPLKLDAAQGATQVVVRPGQTFQVAIHVLKTSGGAREPYTVTINTPCGCSKPTGTKPVVIDTSPPRGSSKGPSCQSEDGVTYIDTKSECDRAAKTLGLEFNDMEDLGAYDDSKPYGCYYQNLRSLKFNPPPRHRQRRKQIEIEKWILQHLQAGVLLGRQQRRGRGERET